MTLEIYRSAALGQTLQDVVDEFVRDGQISNQLGGRMMEQFDKIFVKALSEKVKTRINFKSKLEAYRYCDDVWQLVLKNFSTDQGVELHFDRLKIVACQMLKLATHFLNKYLSPYVKNIDESKLKLQLTSGSVALENLELVETVLDELDLPLSIVSGHLKRLTLKVPWHKIYTAPTIVTIDGLYVLLSPKSELSYDAEKEREQMQNDKIKQVKLFEQRAQDRKEQTPETNEPKSLGTVEKLAMTVVKNLQIRINNIHIRYEDGYSCPGTVLAAGAMLDSLTFDSANENYIPTLVEELTERFFKLVQLKNFSLYLDVPLQSSDRYSSLAVVSVDRLSEKMLTDIEAMGYKTDIPSHSFVIAPFSATARLKLNTRPELTAFREPRVNLDLDLEAFSLGIGEKQYRTAIELIDAVDYIRLRYKYRKYRPTVPCKGKDNVRKWWNFATTCVINDKKGIFYSATKMVEFLRVCKHYRQLYFLKLTRKSISDDNTRQLAQCEEKLDAFNIVLQRRQAEMEAKRLGLLQPPASSTGGSWISSIFGWKSRESPPPLAGSEPSSTVSFAKQLDEALTAEDKAQLIKSIGLDEEGQELRNVPPEYVAFRVGVDFRSLEVNCYDSTSRATVGRFVLSTISADVALRSNKSIRIAGRFRRLCLTGIDGVRFAEAPAQGFMGQENNNHLLSFEFDSKTLESGDQSLTVESQPIGIYYHAVTVNRLREFFTLPPSAKLQAVSEIANQAAQDFKEKSVGFVKSILDDRPFVDIRVQLRGGFVVLPEKGDLAVAKQVMVADLGMLSIHAEPKRNSAEINVDFDQLDAAKSSKQQQAILRELLNSAYNRFSISVEPIQVFLCNADDDWQSARGKPASDLHLLPPLHVKALFGMCIISDPRLPATSIDCALHPSNIVIDVRDTRLRSALVLVASIPFIPPPPPATPAAMSPLTSPPVVMSPSKFRRMSSQTGERFGGDTSRSGSTRQALAQLSSTTQLTPTGKPANSKLFALSFTLNQLTCQFTDSQSAVLLRAVVGQLRVNINADAYTRSGSMTLHSLHFQHQRLSSSPANRPIHNLVNTAVSLVPSTTTSFSSGLNTASSGSPGTASDRTNLLSVRFLYADPLGPEFDTTHSRRRLQLSVRVGAVELLLHREAILDVIRVANSLIDTASAASQNQPSGAVQEGMPGSGLKKKSGLSSSRNSIHSSLLSLADDVTNRLGDTSNHKSDRISSLVAGARPRRKPEITHLYVDAKLDRISAVMRTEDARLGSMQIGGLAARVSTKLLSTTIETSLLELAVFSSVSPAPEDTRQILVLAGASTDSSPIGNGNEIVAAKLTVYNHPPGASTFVDVEAADIAIEVRLAQLRLLVVQRFVENIIDYGLGFGDSLVDKVKEAGSDIAKQAKEGIKQIQADAKKIRLELAISSPVIIVPRTPDEMNAFFAIHLGRFLLSNEFEMRSQDDNEAALAAARSQLAEIEEQDETEESHEAALLNRIRLELSGVKLVRGWADNIETIVEANLESHCQLPLVGPISLNVELVQNLSAAFASFASTALKFADFKVVVNLKSIDVSMCQGDYFMILDVVEWISSTKFGGKTGPKPSPNLATAGNLAQLAEIAADQSVYQTAESHLEAEEQQNRTGPRAKSTLVVENRKVLDVSCHLEKVTCSLYSGDVDFSHFISRSSSLAADLNSSTQQSITERQVCYNPADLLASLCIQDVQASFVILGNDNKTALVTVLNMTVDDSRPSSKAALRVTRLLECFNQLSAMKINPLVPQKPPKLIVFKFEESPQKQSRLVSMELSNLHGCVNAQFVVLLANFFTGVPKKINNLKKPNETAVASPTTALPRDREATAAIGPSITTRLFFKLAGPKLLLLDDPTAEKSAALALQFDFAANIILHEGTVAGSASLSDLAVYWGAYDNLKTGDTDCAQRLLKPVAIDVVLSESATDDGPVGRLRKINVSSGDISLSVTPPAIRTVSIVTRELSGVFAAPQPQQVRSTRSSMNINDSLWRHRPIENFRLEFLQQKMDSATEALELIGQPEPVVKNESSVTLILANIPSVTIKLSTGSKRKVVPLIKLRSSFGARAQAFSNGELDAVVQFDLEVAYYNDQLYIWEPLLEPVECTVPGMPLLFYPPSDVIRHRRAIFNISVMRNVTQQLVEPEQMPASSTIASGISEIAAAEEEVPTVVMPQAVATIIVQTSDILQFVVTKIGLNVLTAVGQSFSKAYRVEEMYTSDSSDVKAMYPVILYNHTDTKFTVKPDASLVCDRVVGGDQPYSAATAITHPQHINLGSGAFAALDYNSANTAQRKSLQQQVSHQPSTSTAVLKKNTSKLLTYEDQRSYKFTIYADDYRSNKELVVNRANSVLFRVTPIGGDVTAIPHAFVCQVSASEGNMVVEFTSVVKVTNSLLEPIDVMCRFSAQQPPTTVLGLQPGRSGYLPLKAIYSSMGGFLIKPLNDNFVESSNSVDLGKKQKQTVLACPSTQTGQPPFLFSTYVDVVKVDAEKQLSTGFVVDKEDTYHLYVAPLITVKNLLPFAIDVSDMYQPEMPAPCPTYTIEAGRQQPFRHCHIPDSPLVIRLTYCEEAWTANFKVSTICITKNTYITFESASDKKLDLAFFMQAEHGSIVLSLYSPYWFVNRTGMAVTYRLLDPDTIFEHAIDGPLLVSVGCKNSTKRKIQLRVGESEWSEKVSIDAVGSAGTIVCKFRNNFSYDGGDARSTDFQEANSERQRFLNGPGSKKKKRRCCLCCCSSSDNLLSPQRMVGMKIVLASCKLTKIITLTPFFFLVNKCPFDIQCQEAIESAKVYNLYRAPPDQCTAFWPMEQDVTKQRMTVTVKETGQMSVPFPFALQDNMLLKFDAPIYGINVACYVCDGAIHITFEPYSEGLAPALIVNHTHRMQLEYFQEKVQQHELLDSMEATLFTWQDPALDKNLQWAPYDIARRICVRPSLLAKAVSAVHRPSNGVPASASSGSISSDLPPATKYYATDVTKDGTGSFQADPDTKVFWVSFMHKKQRVLLFTEDQELASKIHFGQGELEQKNLELTLKIAAVGLSLVDNLRKTELVYAAITPSAVEWQYKRKKFKPFSTRENSLLESAHEQYERKRIIDPNSAAEGSRIALDNGKFEVDFIRMCIHKGDHKIEIRRVCQDGIWLNSGFSDFHWHFHFKLNRIQIDNQTPEARYQTALAPVPPPKSVAADSATPKPFVELSLLLRKQPDAQMLLFKYFKVLVQEMALQVDLPFILQLVSFFMLSESSLEEEYVLFQHDIERTTIPLEKTDLGPELSGGQKHFFELLHISPLKVHLSFSPQSTSGSLSGADETAAALGDVGSFLLTSVGILSGDVTDAVFRLGYYQQNSMLLTVPQLMQSLTSYYTQQALRQFFNVLLGFDVIGNPVGVLRGFASGVETLFYEPWQGAIQGPEELAMGVAIGLQQFFGKTVGGVTGALSKMTGTIGQGLSKLTFDDDYQRARKAERLENKSVGQSLAYGGQQLVLGLFDGVTGIVRKPVEGAQKEGVEGFFKGLGVGLVGVVTRPTGGVIDFAATGLDTIRRVADAAEELKRLRPPRLILFDGIIRPYLYAEAEANNILIRVEKGRFKVDMYAGHLLLSKDGKRLIIITERGLLGMSRSEMLSSWDTDFAYYWTDLRDLPALAQEGIIIPLKERQKRLGFLTGQQVSRVVQFNCDRKLAEEFVTRMQEAKNRVS